MNRSATLGELRGLLDIASDDELQAAHILLSGIAIRHALQHRRYTENQLSGDGSGGDHERGYRKGWNDAMRHMEREFSAPPSSSHNEFASAGGGATFDPLAKTQDCTDCHAPGSEPHLSHCPWRVIVPGKGE